MLCLICNTPLKFTSRLTPYRDQDWKFNIYDCPTCDVRMASKQDKENIPNHLDIHTSKSGGYDKHYAKAHTIKQLIDTNQKNKALFWATESEAHAAIYRIIRLHKKKYPRILEIGCSTGYFTAVLRSLGYDAYGQDISPTATAFANDQFGNFFYTELPKETFDIVFAIGTIGCVDNPKNFFSLCYQYVSKNGILFFNVPNKSRLIEDNIIWKGTMPPDLNFFFSKSTIPYLFDTKSIKYTAKEIVSYQKNAIDFLKDKHPTLESIQRTYKTTNSPNKYHYIRARTKKIFLSMLGWIFTYVFRFKKKHLYGLHLIIRKTS